jgi:hypothetical protein
MIRKLQYATDSDAEALLLRRLAAHLNQWNSRPVEASGSAVVKLKPVSAPYLRENINAGAQLT